jgi:hypothetical protein
MFDRFSPWCVWLYDAVSRRNSCQLYAHPIRRISCRCNNSTNRTAANTSNNVSHQCYPNKVLTGRQATVLGLRQHGGIFGLCKRSESAYDSFGAGHSSISSSVAQGMNNAKSRLNKRRNNCIAMKS